MVSDRVVHEQDTATDSPWTVRERVRMLLFEWVWFLFCRWTPKPFNRWRLVVLRAFGCRIHGHPFVHQRARIQIPWRVELEDGSSIGDRANLYSLGRISVGSGAVIAQEAYLSTGSHDFSQHHIPLVTDSIRVDSEAFVGARAIVLPGVHVGARSVIGAGAVVTKDVAPGVISAGNPSRPIRVRGASRKSASETPHSSARR